MKHRATLILLLGALTMGSIHATQENLKWQEEKGKTVSLLKDGKPLWTYHYSRDLAKPYFHPLCTADGHNLAWLNPPDHVWHFALWHSWKYINKVNYWEPNRKTGRPDGTTEIANVQTELREDFSAIVRLDMTYHLPDQPVLMTEQRTITVTPLTRKATIESIGRWPTKSARRP